ncbi:MAG TPA: TIGR03084 family metal-binding protein [Acidimicrobiales bacterium]|nr:TIGR03084 family metal-binding protein [Acidimicrobiales bacterium]
MPDMQAMAADVQAEHDDLARLLRDLSDDVWDGATAAPGWSVRDQVTHLAVFDDVARMAIEEPEAFVQLRDRERGDVQRYVHEVNERGRGLVGAEMLEWFARERAKLVHALRTVDPSSRIPWFGPDMSPASKATARLMETWAHGQDIVDALQLDRPPTARLYHVAYIGVRAVPNSFRANGRDVPDVNVYVALDAPQGDRWVWGDADAPDRVEGDALDFCLVVTQRRHVDDTDLVVTGAVAREWMQIAQAFAGPPGAGRTPGQFRAPGSKAV